MATKGFPWKVVREGEQIASCKHPEDAAVLVSVSGGKVKFGSWVVWTEGKEVFSAGESYDRAAETMDARRYQKARAQFDRYEAQQAATKARREVAQGS